MANSALELSIKIAGKLDPSITQAFNDATKQVSSFSSGISTIAKATIGTAAATATAITLGIGKCTESAAEFKNEMADVVKYVGGLADENGEISNKVFDSADGGNGKTYAENYAEVSEILKVLSTQIPMTKNDLTQLAAAAGQSGKSIGELFTYDDNETIRGFLRDAAMLGAAWDISADLAGDYAAKWEKAFALEHDQVMILADQINYLGANTATTAAEIASVVNDSAGLGQIAGMTPATTAALADAMLAMGVNSGTAATSVRRLITNMSLGASATDAQETAWLKLGFTAESVAKSMQQNSEGTMLSVFRAINELDADEQVGMLKTLFGQWSIEGAAKIVGNIDELVRAFEMVQDFDSYNGSMQREFIIKSTTPEAVDLMTSNARDNLKVDIGDSFLPIQQELALMKIDFFEGIRANLPELSQLANSIMPLLRAGMESIGATLEKAMPYAQQLIDYILENGDKVAGIFATIGATLAGMLFAPQIEKTIGGVGSLLFGGTGSLPGTGSKATGGIAGTVSNGVIGLLGQADTMISGATYGSQMYGGLNGALIGALTARKRGSASSIPFVKSMLAADGGESGFDMIRHTGIGQYFTNIATKAGALGNTKIGSSILGAAASLGSSAKGTLQGIVGSAGALGSGIFGAIKSSAPAQTIGRAATALWSSWPVQTAAGIAGKATSLTGNAIGNVGSFAGSALNLGGAALSPLLNGGLEIFTGLMGTFGPIIAGVGSIIAIVSIFGDHLDDIRGLIQNTFGEKGVAIFDSFVSTVQSVGDKITGAFSLEGLQNVQESIRGIFGDGAADSFGAAIPIIQSIADVFGQIVDLGVNHIKPLILEVASFVVDELWPAVGPILGTIISLVGTALVNAIKVAVDVFDMMLPVIEPIALGIVDLFGGIVSVVTGVVNGIIRALNEIQFDIPEWVPVIGGKHFGFNLSEIQTTVLSGANALSTNSEIAPNGGITPYGGAVEMEKYASGGFTHGISIAGEAGTEAVISFNPGVRSQNIITWVQAGRMLGVDGNQAAQAAGIQNIRYFANGGFTNGQRAGVGNGKLILFSSALSLLANTGRALLSGDPATAMQDLVGTDFRRTASEILNLASDNMAIKELAAGRSPIYLRDLYPQSGNDGITLKEWPNAGRGAKESFPGGPDSDRPVQYVFAPQLTIYGNADREEISEAMDAEYEKFKRNVERFEREKRRTGYAS